MKYVVSYSLLNLMMALE